MGKVQRARREYRRAQRQWVAVAKAWSSANDTLSAALVELDTDEIAEVREGLRELASSRAAVRAERDALEAVLAEAEALRRERRKQASQKVWEATKAWGPGVLQVLQVFLPLVQASDSADRPSKADVAADAFSRLLAHSQVKLGDSDKELLQGLADEIAELIFDDDED